VYLSKELEDVLCPLQSAFVWPGGLGG
jgi:hypothetical protein